MADHSYLEWPFFEESHRELSRAVSAWAAKEISASHGTDVFTECRELAKKFGAAGWLKYSVPLAFGGAHAELDVRSIAIIRESIGYHSGLAEFVFALQGLGSGPISLFGNETLKKRYLPKVARGEYIPAFAISEADAGSDVAAMVCSAAREGESYVINGAKTWISNAGIADFYVTFARLAGSEKGYIALVVDAGTPGMLVSERIEITAPHPLGTIEFKDCRVPRTALVGVEGDGLKVALGTLDVFRTTVGAAALGFARRALDEAVGFAQTRKVFGQALSETQITQVKLAEMALAIDSSALLVYRSAWTRDVRKRRVTREAAMAKLHATESAQRVIDEAVQILGGRGVVAGSVCERLYREVRALRIYEGTSEIQKLIIAQQVLKSGAGGANVR